MQPMLGLFLMVHAACISEKFSCNFVGHTVRNLDTLELCRLEIRDPILKIGILEKSFALSYY